MATTRTFRFGPGALESIELRIWTAPNRTTIGRRLASDPRRLVVEVAGTFDVARPIGIERVAIRERAGAWTSETDEFARLLTEARRGGADAAELVAEQLVEWALEDWSPADDLD